jgi:SAM-dependent methyltransferase
MDIFTNRDHLREVQYRDSSNLQSRISLHQAFSVNPIPWQEWVFSHLDLDDRAYILELGCGPGDLWVDNHEMMPDTWTLFVSDLSIGMVRESIQRIRAWRKAVGLVVDAARIPYRENVFNSVIANHVLFHIDPPSDALQEIHRVLRPGGMLYATTVGRDHLLELREAIMLAREDAFDIREEESARALLGFTLETGPQKVQHHFKDVDVRVHEDWLEVPEVEPLIRYITSSSVWDLDAEQLMRFSDIIGEKLTETGVMTIRKHQGIVVARK